MRPDYVRRRVTGIEEQGMRRGRPKNGYIMTAGMFDGASVQPSDTEAYIILQRSGIKVRQDETKAPVTPGLRPGYDLATTECFRNRGQIVERTHDWSRRSWTIARAKSVATRPWSC